MVTFQRQEALPVDLPRVLVRWGAVFAGLALVFALSWLLFLFGSALGVTVADGSDAQTDDGLGVGAVVWLLLTVLVAYFFGGMVAARLAGSADRGSGVLHGLTLWGAATAAMLLFGYWGLSGMVDAGQSLAHGSWAAESPGAIAANGHARASHGTSNDGPEAAKRTLAARTTLAQEQLDALSAPLDADVDASVDASVDVSVDVSVDAETSRRLTELRAETRGSVGTISDSTKATLWGFFGLLALALLACVGGGWYGADRVRRLLTVRTWAPAR